jgi:hypothetical protein
MLLRGGSEQFIAESERSIHDAMIRGSGGKKVIFSNCPYDKSEYSDSLIYIPI